MTPITTAFSDNLSDDVIDDLLTLYLAGEASADTRALIEAHLETHPELAERAARSQALELPETELDPNEKEREMKSLERTKKLIRLQSWLFGFAIFFSASLFSFGSFDERGLHWIVLGSKVWPVYAAAAALCWTAWFAARRRLA